MNPIMTILWFYMIFTPFYATGSLSVSEFLSLKPKEKIARADQLSKQEKNDLLQKNLKQIATKQCIGCYFENGTLEGNFSGAVLTGSVFKNVTLKNANFSNATLNDVIIAGGEIVNCNFTGAIAPGITLTGINPLSKPLPVTNSTFSKAILNRAQLNIDGTKVTFDDIQGIELKLRLSKFDSQSSFRKANLQLMDCFAVEFNQSDLSQADMRNATLVETNFFGSRLTNAYFNDALIAYTQITDVQADGMHLEGTNFLYAVNFAGANLAKSSTSPQTNWQGAHFCQTIMPNLTSQTAINSNYLNKDAPERWTPLSSLNSADQKWWQEQAKTKPSLIQNKNLPFINNNDCGKPAITHPWEKDSLDVEKNISKLMLTNQCLQCFLEGADLRGKNLSGAQLQGSWLVNANLQGANLSGANLKSTRISGAKVDGSTKFNNAYLCNTRMPEDLYMPGDNLRNDDCTKNPPPLTQLPLSQQETTQAKNLKTLLKTKSCSDCDFSYITINDKVDLSQANAPNANFLGAKIANATLNSAQFPNARFGEATLTNVSALNINLSYTNCPSLIIEGPRSDFTRANFSHANLEEALFKNITQLSFSNFEQANCFKSVFNGCIMKHASLKKAHCYGAQFIGADLTNTNLIGTYLGYANLTDADLTGAAIDSTTNFDNTIFCRTKMPDGKMRNDNCQQ